MRKRLLTAILATSLCSLNTTAQQGSRLIGEGNYTYLGGFFNPVDTCTSSYTPGAFDTDKNEWQPNTCLCGAYNMGNYYYTTRTTNTFNSQQQVDTSTEELYDTTAGVWEFQFRDFYTYTASKKIATLEGQHYNSGNWTTQLKWTYTYNSQDSLIDKLLQYNIGSGLENYSREKIHYNSSNQRDTVTYLLWDSGTMTWDPDKRTTYYYNTPNPIAQVIAQFVGGNWQEFDSLINTLDANSNILTQLHKTFNGLTSWVNQSNQINTYDANNNRLTSITQLYAGGSFVNSTQTTNVYNTFNQPTQTTVQSWDAATSAFTWQNGNTLGVFTYETVVTGIQGAVAKNDAMRLYPMPASNKLTLDLNWKNMQDAKVIMLDMMGKIAGVWSGPGIQQGMHTVDISNIPAGVYMLKVVGTQGVLSQKVSIVR